VEERGKGPGGAKKKGGTVQNSIPRFAAFETIEVMDKKIKAGAGRKSPFSFKAKELAEKNKTER